MKRCEDGKMDLEFENDSAVGDNISNKKIGGQFI